VLCTANQCRSPMAEALLRDRLDALGVDADVTSAGELPGGAPASGGSVRAMSRRGIDIGRHVSRSVTPEILGRADLVLAMSRRHLRNAVALRPDLFGRAYTLKELVRRGEVVGRRPGGASLADWLDAVHAGRSTAALLGDDAEDDVADPIGGPDHLYDGPAEEIADLVDRLVHLVFATQRETA
jgi:protein-tyrosine phosphatase